MRAPRGHTMRTPSTRYPTLARLRTVRVKSVGRFCQSVCSILTMGRWDILLSRRVRQTQYKLTALASALAAAAASRSSMVRSPHGIRPRASAVEKAGSSLSKGRPRDDPQDRSQDQAQPPSPPSSAPPRALSWNAITYRESDRRLAHTSSTSGARGSRPRIHREELGGDGCEVRPSAAPRDERRRAIDGQPLSPLSVRPAGWCCLSWRRFVRWPPSRCRSTVTPSASMGAAPTERSE
jgi:hypothetical protein